MGQAGRATTFVCGLAAMAALLLGLVLTAKPAHATTFTITENADTNDGSCDADCSLREAMVAANSNGQTDTIRFTSSVEGTIYLNSALPGVANDTGDQDLTIKGPGANRLTLSGSDNLPIFSVASGAKAAMSGLMVSDGHASLGGPSTLR